jgi:hypothetical protein
MSQFELTALRPLSGVAAPPRPAWTDREGDAAPCIWPRWASPAAVAAICLFAGLAAILWHKGGLVVPWDSKNHFYPMFRFLAEALSRGEWPAWNPYHFGGHPAVADPQSLLFTPTMVIFAYLCPHASMEQFDGVILGHLLLGGCGMLALFQRRRWHPLGAILAAIVFMLGGAASSRLQHTGMIISYAFFPFALLTLEIALERKTIRCGIAFVLFAVLLAIGRDQVAFLLCLALIGMALTYMLQSGRPLAWLRERLPMLTVILLGTIVLLAVPTLLTLQFLGASNRPGIAYGIAAAGSLAPVNFLTLLAPNVFGSLDWNYDYWGPGYETMASADWTDRAVNYLFIGTLPILLIIWHGIACGRLWAASMRPVLAVAGVALLYALGHYTPVFGFIFDHLPGVSLYRRPADATFVLNIVFAIVAGYLVHHFLAAGSPALIRIYKFPVPALLVAILVSLGLGGGMAFATTTQQLQQSLLGLGLATLIAVTGVAVLRLCSSRSDRRAIAGAALVLFSAGELLWRNAASSLNAEPAARYSVYDHLSSVEQTGFDVLRADILVQKERGDHPRVEILGLGGAWQNASMVLGLENTLGYNPLRIADYERAVGPGENAGDPNLRKFPGTFRGYKCKLAALLGLEYLVLDRPLTRLPRHFPRPRATPLFAASGMYIYKLGTSAPRAYLATTVTPVDSQEVLADHALPEFDRAHEALIDESSLPLLRTNYGATYGTNDAPAADANVTIAAYHDQSVWIEVDTSRAGIVVLHDLFYPGWEVTVDGQSRPILRANLLFRGVEVPPGHHLVEFKFRPFSVSNLLNALASLDPHDAKPN